MKFYIRNAFEIEGAFALAIFALLLCPAVYQYMRLKLIK